MAGSAAARETPPKIVVVDDDALFREPLERNLAQSGFDVTGVATGAEALDVIADENAIEPDLVILDWRMPEMSGMEVLLQLRARRIRAPVIFLTALSDQIYEEAALIEGAVDFVEKSRSYAILRHRIDLALGRDRAAGGTGAPETAAWRRVGALEISAGTARAQWRGRPVPLTLSEFRIVDYLSERAGQDVRYREIYDLVRGSGFAAGPGVEGYRSNVRAFVKRIRSKFRAMDPDFDAIENYPGFGYRWHHDEVEPPR